MKILGIETSCDETGVAIFCEKEGIIENKVFSQVDLHRKYGGVIPELASRDHIRKTLPLIKSIFKERQLGKQDISGIAYTAGPGLVGALLVGASVAKSLALAWRVPAIGVHHMEGHLLATLLTEDPPNYPFIALLVSGGHSQLIACYEKQGYQLLGESQDDAAGEAFDKVAKMLGLNYPGGPVIEKLAKKGDPKRFAFPRPMTKKPGLNFSFSGLKTNFKRFVETLDMREPGFIQKEKYNLCASLQYTISEILYQKVKKAIQITKVKDIVYGGGVSANSMIRERFKSNMRDVNHYFPKLEYTTDNAAMIAMVGYLKYKSKNFGMLNAASDAKYEM